MVEAGTLCGNADVAKLAGSGANATAAAEAWTNVAILWAEAYVCATSRYDWVTNIASVSTIGKEFLTKVTASLTAIYVIEYDTTGYPSQEDCQVRIDKLNYFVVECINLLRDEAFRNFILNGSVS